jgi:hypothetical protein
LRVSHTSDLTAPVPSPSITRPAMKTGIVRAAPQASRPQLKNRESDLQREGRSVPFGVFANSHRADKAAEHEPAETPGVERQSPQSKSGYGHDRSNG